MEASSYMLIDMTVENLIKLSAEDLKKQIALTIVQDEDGCWKPFTDDILEREEDFVPDAVDDGLKTMDDLIASLNEEDRYTVQKYIELEGSEISNDNDEYAELYVPCTFDWGKYREDKAKENAA